MRLFYRSERHLQHWIMPDPLPPGPSSSVHPNRQGVPGYGRIEERHSRRVAHRQHRVLVEPISILLDSAEHKLAVPCQSSLPYRRYIERYASTRFDRIDEDMTDPWQSYLFLVLRVARIILLRVSFRDRCLSWVIEVDDDNDKQKPPEQAWIPLEKSVDVVDRHETSIIMTAQCWVQST